MPHQVIDMTFKNQPPLRIVLGGDEAGFDYKKALIADLQKDSRIICVTDVGPKESTDTTAYPHYALAAARMVCPPSLSQLQISTSLVPCNTKAPFPSLRAAAP